MLGSQLAFVLQKLPLIPSWLKQFSSHVNCADHTVSHPWKNEMEPMGSQIPQSLRAPGRNKRLRNVLLGTVCFPRRGESVGTSGIQQEGGVLENEGV